VLLILTQCQLLLINLRLSFDLFKASLALFDFLFPSQIRTKLVGFLRAQDATEKKVNLQFKVIFEGGEFGLHPILIFN
jgi:hypothetical protein